MGVFADPANRFWAVAGVAGIVLGAAYMLWLYQRVMFGENDNPKNQGLTDLTSRELATFVPLIVLAFWIGLYPKTFLQYLHDPVNEIVEIVRPGEFPAISEQNAAKE
jgi:NADH-quinone oxidoreductase subunit M